MLWTKVFSKSILIVTKIIFLKIRDLLMHASFKYLLDICKDRSIVVLIGAIFSFKYQNYFSCFQIGGKMAFYKQLLKRECNKSVKISILCLTNLVRISESCEAFPLLKFFVSFLIPHFIPFLMSVTLWKENLLLENRSLIILMLA